ncbi:hypothetical protein D3C72_1328700 [compost metagenome]
MITRNGWRPPISIGISQLALPSTIAAPAATRSLRKIPNGPTTTNANGAVTNRIIIGLVKNLIIVGDTFSANRSI